VFETYRMLGEQRDAERLREAQRLHAGQASREVNVLRTPGRRFVSVVRSKAVVLLNGLRGSTTPATEKPPRSQLDS